MIGEKNLQGEEMARGKTVGDTVHGLTSVFSRSIIKSLPCLAAEARMK